jgi:hypothetical protein
MLVAMSRQFALMPYVFWRGGENDHEEQVQYVDWQNAVISKGIVQGMMQFVPVPVGEIKSMADNNDLQTKMTYKDVQTTKEVKKTSDLSAASLKKWRLVRDSASDKNRKYVAYVANSTDLHSLDKQQIQRVDPGFLMKRQEKGELISSELVRWMQAAKKKERLVEEYYRGSRRSTESREDDEYEEEEEEEEF